MYSEPTTVNDLDLNVKLIQAAGRALKDLRKRKWSGLCHTAAALLSDGDPHDAADAIQYLLSEMYDAACDPSPKRRGAIDPGDPRFVGIYSQLDEIASQIAAV